MHKSKEGHNWNYKSDGKMKIRLYSILFHIYNVKILSLTVLDSKRSTTNEQTDKPIDERPKSNIPTNFFRIGDIVWYAAVNIKYQ